MLKENTRRFGLKQFCIFFFSFVWIVFVCIVDWN